MKLLNVPFVIITICTLIGISIGYYVDINPNILLGSFFLSVLLLSIIWFRSKRLFNQSVLFGIFMVLSFILFGVVLLQIHNPKNYPTHYSNKTNNIVFEKPTGIQFSVKERLKSTAYYHKYILAVNIINNDKVKGDLLLQIPLDSLTDPLAIGDSYTTFTQLKPITKALNPYQFDYAKYLSKQYIYHFITSSPNLLIKQEQTEFPIFRLADQIRTNINLELQRYNFDLKQLSIINALILGQRQDIEQDTFNAYRDAGAIHILAVSGLHIGILLLILNFLLKPLETFGKQGKLIKLVVSIFLLWCFGIIAGLSPSVLRAVTMFSFIAIGIYIRSKTSIYNSLFVSMFILLCFNPLLLFSVGFQLSYLAVFAIVWIQPLLAKYYQPKTYISNKIWETFTVTVAAQIGVLPLTLFYFHQFPLLFFISNLIIIPFLGSILGLGILVIALASLKILPQFLADFFGNCIDLMNALVGWVADQKNFLITEVPFSLSIMVTLYTVIIIAVLTIQRYSKNRIYGLAISIVILISVIVYTKQNTLNISEFVVFHNQYNTTIGILENRKLKVYSKGPISEKSRNYVFKNYLIQNQAELDTITQLKNAYQYKDYKVLIIDSSSIYQIKNMNPDILILANSPKIHLDRVLDSLKPKKVIIDGSNYRSYVNLWERSCNKYNIPLHQINLDGAFILNNE